MANDSQPPEAAAAAPRAWQPFTPQGVAAFAAAGYGRALALLMVFGLLIGMVMTWFVRGAWFPALAQAAAALPRTGEIRDGRLHVEVPQSLPLAGNRYVSLAIDLQHTGEQTLPADLEIEFGAAEVRLRGMLGYVDVPYPRALAAPFHRAEAVPWWGAWSQAILAGVWVGSTLGLMGIWSVLALAYVPLARVLAWLRGAPLGVGAAWRLCAAALMPGALMMTAAIALYGWGLMDVLRLGLVAVFHVMVAWVYVPLAVGCLPRAQQTVPGGNNPFTDSPTTHR